MDRLIRFVLTLLGFISQSAMGQKVDSQSTAVIKIPAVERTVQTVSYRAKSGETKIDFKGIPTFQKQRVGKVGTKEGNLSIRG